MKKKRTEQASGFTLIEVLLAVFILGVIMVTIFGSFQVLFSNTEAVEGHLRAYEMAQGCFSRIMSDLMNIHITDGQMYKPPEGITPPDPYRLVCEQMDTPGEGARFKLRFASGAHLPFSSRLSGGIGEITYYVDGTDDGQSPLRRSDCNVLEASPELPRNDPILCRNVKSLQFFFYDETGSEHETWDSDAEETGNATPVAVRIVLEIENESIAYSFETMVALPVRRLKRETTP